MIKQIPIALLCQTCGNVLSSDVFNLFTSENLICNKCYRLYTNHDGIIDFSGLNSEIQHYNNVYKKTNITYALSDFNLIEKEWGNPVHPEYRLFYKHFINIKNRKILLLGNGVSYKELFFLINNNKIIYTDISINALVVIKKAFKKNPYSKNVIFHAVDAMHLPFSDSSVDVVVGYALVHHLDDILVFLKGIHRVLRPGGICIFYDSAYSFVWQKAKSTILKPIVKWTHIKRGISPADLHATDKGGFKLCEIIEYNKVCNFSNYIYMRFGFLYQIYNRAMIKILGQNRLSYFLRRIMTPLLFIYDQCCTFSLHFYRNNTINLIWGFKNKVVII